MDRRMFDMTDIYNQLRAVEQNDTNVVPECYFNSDYCVKTPQDFNNGILTMAFVDMQPLNSVYETEDAFCRGSLFPNIDKPFWGGKRR